MNTVLTSFMFLTCLALASSASFGEMRQLAASLGYGQGRPNIQERFNVAPVDPMTYLMPQLPQQNKQFTGLTSDPSSGFDLIRQLSQQKSGKGGFNSKFAGASNQYNPMSGFMGMQGMQGMGMGMGMQQQRSPYGRK